jgi:hypothetical protein
MKVPYTFKPIDRAVLFELPSQNDMQAAWLSSALSPLKYSNTYIQPFWNLSEFVSNDDLVSRKRTAEKSQKQKERFKNQFLASIKESVFDYGYSSDAENYFLSTIDSVGETCLLWLTEVFAANFDKAGVIEGVLRVIANIPYDTINSTGLTLATAALSHKSDVVKENAIRAFENWNDERCLPVLENIECANDFLQEYLNSVIAGIREDSVCRL